MMVKTASKPAPRAPDPDFVDRLFELLTGDPRLPRMDGKALSAVKADLRDEFGGQRFYITLTQDAALKRRERIDSVLRLFDGQNATTIARTLGIGRATVYRILRTAGRRPHGSPFKVAPADRLTFARPETDGEISSGDA